MASSISRVQHAMSQLKAHQIETNTQLSKGELFPFSCNIQQQFTETFGEKYTVLLNVDIKINPNFDERFEEIKVVDNEDPRGPTVVASYNTRLHIDLYQSEDGAKIYASGLGTNTINLNRVSFALKAAMFTTKHPDFNEILTLVLLHQMENAARLHPRTVAKIAMHASLENTP